MAYCLLTIVQGIDTAEKFVRIGGSSPTLLPTIARLLSTLSSRSTEPDAVVRHHASQGWQCWNSFLKQQLSGNGQKSSPLIQVLEE